MGGTPAVNPRRARPTRCAAAVPALLVLVALLSGCAAGTTGTAETAGTTTTAAPVPQDRAPAAVGEAHESEVPSGWAEPGDGPVTPVEGLDAEDRRALLRIRASSDPVEAACTGEDLAAELSFTDAALGHRYGLITVTHTGVGDCAVRGYPGLGARGAWGNPFVNELEQNPVDLHGRYLPGGDESVPQTLTLSAGESAQLLVEWTGTLGGAESEPLGDLLLQPFRGADAVVVTGAAEQASDLSMFTTVKVGPFLQPEAEPGTG
ncbi:DUF4232 domain-containing protein [Microbacterium sp. A93]|uniref:DUF4232 domain-containing protein n=1 Tax=Microbacterium sp. A93 TaxID=3450716 RepID=UPI003F4274E5